MVRLQRNDPLEIAGKRSRPVSSLDFTVDRSEQPPKLVSSAGSTSREHEPPPEKSEWKRNSGGSDNSIRQMTTPLTRSRGSSGIPKQPRTLADLEGMTQQEMSEALDNDPSLAEELKLATEQYQQQQRQQQQQQQQREAGTTRRSSSGKSSSFVKGGDRATILKENGVPYQQWGILLLCLGIGLHQVYKAMKPPGSGKTQKGHSKQKAKVSAKLSKSQIDDAVIAELEGSVATAPHAATKRAKKKKPTKTVTKAPLSSLESTTVPHVTPVPRSKKHSSESQTEIFFEEVVEEGEWKTVGNLPVPKTTKTAEAPATTTTTVVADDAITVHTSNTSKKKKKNGASAAVAKVSADLVKDKDAHVTESNGGYPAKPASMMNGSSSSVAAPVHQEVVSSSSLQEEVVTPDETLVKKKKIKKKKVKDDPLDLAKSNGASHADADAALAQQLQQEEDQLAASEQAAAVLEKSNGTVSMELPNEEDEWAEVTKKKKPVKAPTTAEGESDAAAAATAPEPTVDSSAEKESLSAVVEDE